MAKEVEVNQDKCESLWCKRCQRGLSGVVEAEGLVEGDDCPLCLDLAKYGNIAENSIGVLKKISTAVKEHEELVRIRRREKELKMHRGIKGTDELIKEAKAEQKAELEALKAQIADMQKMLAASQKAK